MVVEACLNDKLKAGSLDAANDWQGTCCRKMHDVTTESGGFLLQIGDS